MDPNVRIDEVIEALEEGIDEYARRSEAAVNAEATYKQTKAEHVILCKAKDLKTVAEREAWVDQKTSEARKEYLVSQARLDVQKQRLQVLRSVLNGYQTLASQSRI
jgi:hypothetical protein